ncbi:MAG: PilN domain-containing protein [Armatimonas sp.]
MPNINLIASRREEKKRLERTAGQLFIGLGSSVGVLLLLASYMAARHLSMNADMSSADQRMEKIQPTLDEIERIKKETADLEPKVEQLETAKLQTLRWQAVFLALSRTTPHNTWLSQVSAAEGESPTVSIQGQTENQHQVADMNEALQREAVFANVEIKGTNAVNVTLPGKGTMAPPEQIQRIQFDLTAQLKPIQKPQAPSAGGEATKTAMATGGKSNG